MFFIGRCLCFLLFLCYIRFYVRGRVAIYSTLYTLCREGCVTIPFCSIKGGAPTSKGGACHYSIMCFKGRGHIILYYTLRSKGGWLSILLFILFAGRGVSLSRSALSRWAPTSKGGACHYSIMFFIESAYFTGRGVSLLYHVLHREGRYSPLVSYSSKRKGCVMIYYMVVLGGVGSGLVVGVGHHT